MQYLRRYIKRMLLESNVQSVREFHASIRNNFVDTGEKHEGSPVYAMHFPDDCRVEFVYDIAGHSVSMIYLVYIETIGDHCFREGYATETMEEFLKIADQTGLDTLLQVESFGEMSDDALLHWYYSLGFDHYDEDLLKRQAR
jgi:hypothetical protein